MLYHLFMKQFLSLADQLQRAATFIPLNIAEGAGEYSGAEKNRFYRIAKRSATDCAGILDICVCLRLIDEEQYIKGRGLLKPNLPPIGLLGFDR